MPAAGVAAAAVVVVHYQMKTGLVSLQVVEFDSVEWWLHQSRDQCLEHFDCDAVSVGVLTTGLSLLAVHLTSGSQVGMTPSCQSLALKLTCLPLDYQEAGESP